MPACNAPAKFRLTWIIRPAPVVGGAKEIRISTNESHRTRRERQTSELEGNQQALRDSIAASRKLVDEADAMIQRHRRECSDADPEG